MTIAVLLSGGSGTRMNMVLPKQYVRVDNHQVLEYTLQAFAECDAIDSVMIVSRKDYIKKVDNMKLDYPKLRWAVEGGNERV